MELFLLYLWTMLDGIGNAISFFLVLTAVVAGVCFFVFLITDFEMKQLPKIGVRFSIAFVFFLALAIAVPSKKDAAILAGAYLAMEASKTTLGVALRARIEQEILNYLQTDKPKK
jgi:hypothetical protein